MACFAWSSAASFAARAACCSAAHALDLYQIVECIVATLALRKPVKQPICGRDNKAAVRLGAILLVRFANQFAGVIGFEILHYADSPRSLDVLLIFAHDDLQDCNKKSTSSANR